MTKRMLLGAAAAWVAMAGMPVAATAQEMHRTVVEHSTSRTVTRDRDHVRRVCRVVRHHHHRVRTCRVVRD